MLMAKRKRSLVKIRKNLACLSAPRDKPREGSRKSISSGSSEDQPVERPQKKEASKNLLDHAEPKLTAAPSKKAGTDKKNIKGCLLAIRKAKKSCLNDHSLPKSASGQKTSKDASSVQSNDHSLAKSTSGQKTSKDASAVRKAKKSLLNDHSLPKSASGQKTSKDASSVQSNVHSLAKSTSGQKTSKDASSVQKNMVGEGAVEVFRERASTFQNIDEKIVGRSNHNVGSEGEITNDSSKKNTESNKGSEVNSIAHLSNSKVLSARTNRVKMRNLLAAAEGADLLKATQLKARKKRLRFQRSKIHDWGLVALEPIEAEDFVIEYVGELIRPRISDIREQYYEKMELVAVTCLGLDDGYVVDATKRGGIARFINHSCEPNCYTKVISVEGQKKIFIYAKRHIAAGEEISYNYKFPLRRKKFLATVVQRSVVIFKLACIRMICHPLDLLLILRSQQQFDPTGLNMLSGREARKHLKGLWAKLEADDVIKTVFA
ncbi:hypothetical protein V6N11_060236 [Hibiscus sabdariffa]|uniref:[histone H3]-lysine(4) N-trimethyltransferase n=1 Tax=Hibiscus sabdariffa TaxID=183260 RepID=A0ABR2QPQ8_9ROSI